MGGPEAVGASQPYWLSQPWEQASRIGRAGRTDQAGRGGQAGRTDQAGRGSQPVESKRKQIKLT